MAVTTQRTMAQPTTRMLRLRPMVLLGSRRGRCQAVWAVLGEEDRSDIRVSPGCPLATPRR